MRRRSVILMGSLGLAALLKCQPITPVVVVGGSMEPTFKAYDILWGSRDFSEIKRGDVVVFSHDGERMIKRVLGLPGDRITSFSIGGYPRLATDPRSLQSLKIMPLPRTTMVVPAGQVYVTGDNEINSIDSRLYGTINATDIEVKVFGVGSERGISASDRIANRLTLQRVGDRWL